MRGRKSFGTRCSPFQVLLISSSLEILPHRAVLHVPYSDLGAGHGRTVLRSGNMWCRPGDPSTRAPGPQGHRVNCFERHGPPVTCTPARANAPFFFFLFRPPNSVTRGGFWRRAQSCGVALARQPFSFVPHSQSHQHSSHLTPFTLHLVYGPHPPLPLP